MAFLQISSPPRPTPFAFGGLGCSLAISPPNVFSRPLENTAHLFPPSRFSKTWCLFVVERLFRSRTCLRFPPDFFSFFLSGRWALFAFIAFIPAVLGVRAAAGFTIWFYWWPLFFFGL